MRIIQNLLFALAVCGLTSGAVMAAASAPKSGVEYDTLAEVQNTDSGNKVEVIEFFSYACPHCHAFDPMLSAWVKQNADRIVFKRVHVAFNPAEAPLQRTYLTMDAMGLTEQFHRKVFAAIHEQRVRLSSDEAIFDWLEKNGADRAKFIGMYRSFGAQSWVNRAQAQIRAYKIEQWPTLAIGGRYMVSPASAGRGMAPGTNEELQQKAALQVMDFLVAKAKAEKK